MTTPSSIGGIFGNVILTFPDIITAYAFSTIGANATTQYNKDELGTNLTQLGINPVNNPITGVTETLSLTNELLRWDDIAMGSLVLCGNVVKGTETAQVITASNGELIIPNKLFINNLVDTNDFIGQPGYFLTTDSNSIPMWTSNLPFPSTTVISTINTNYISSATVVTDSVFFNNLNGVPLTSPIFANPSFSTIYVTQGAQISSLTVTQRLVVSPSTVTQLGVVTTNANCSITAGTGAGFITTTGNHTATTGSFITTSGTVSSLTMSARALTISTINGVVLPTSFYLLPSTLVVPAISTNTISTAQLLTSSITSRNSSTINFQVSTINSLPVSAYIPTTAYSSNVLASAPTIDAVPIASTIITTTTNGNIIATANVSVVSLDNQYHDSYLNLAINNQVSPSTFFSAPSGIGHYGNASLTFRATVSTGTHTIVAYQSAQQAGVMTTATVNLTGMGNLN